MKVFIASRDQRQKMFNLEIKILFYCVKCKKIVEPDELLIGKAHVYALHCDLQQDVGLVA